jgi:hypothetical protein
MYDLVKDGTIRLSGEARYGELNDSGRAMRRGRGNARNKKGGIVC